MTIRIVSPRVSLQSWVAEGKVYVMGEPDRYERWLKDEGEWSDLKKQLKLVETKWHTDTEALRYAADHITADGWDGPGADRKRVDSWLRDEADRLDSL